MIRRNSKPKTKKRSKVWARIAGQPRRVRGIGRSGVVAEIVPPQEPRYVSILDPHGTDESNRASEYRTMGETLSQLK